MGKQYFLSFDYFGNRSDGTTFNKFFWGIVKFNTKKTDLREFAIMQILELQQNEDLGAIEAVQIKVTSFNLV